MLYSEQMKEICDKLGVDRSECKDGLYSTFLQAISDACDNAGGGGITIRNQNKTITENGTYKADSGYTGLGTVNVNVPTPSGTIDITENGSYDVTNFATALVEIAASGGDSGDANQLDALIERSITEVKRNVTSIGNGAFRSCYKLTTVDFPAATSISHNAFAFCSALPTVNFPAATSIGNYAFSTCSALTTVEFPAVTSIGDGAFDNCSVLTTVVFPAATSIGGTAFYACPKLTTADFPAATSIGGDAFYACAKLKVMILRSETMATLSNVGAFGSTGIKTGSGYIYVPRALLSDTDSTKDYRQATNWSTYAARFRALEEYTVDGTTTGELDSTKI